MPDQNDSGLGQTIQNEKYLSGYVGRLLRDHFGKGPESVLVSIRDKYITIYLRNFLSNPERSLLEQDNELIIHQMRDRLMQIVLPSLSEQILSITGVKPEEYYYDWHLANKSGFIVAVNPVPIPGAPGINADFAGKTELERGVIKVSLETEKYPDEIMSFEIDPRTIMIIRKGILIRIEREFIRLGQAEWLRVVKRNLERSYLLHLNMPEDPNSARRIADVFVDYHFERDISAIFIVRSTAGQSCE